MSKPVDNKHTKNLDELLDHLHPDRYREGGDDLDAFEKEALEGFASLETKQEALDMKQRLDERMEEKFSKKRKPLFIYWSAAAGIALIIGLVFLMQTNQDLKSKELADNSVINEKQLESPGNNSPAPPAELKQEVTKKMAGKADLQHAQGETMSYNNGPVQRSSSDQEASSKSALEEVALDDAKNEQSKEGEKDGRRDEKPSDDLAANKGSNNGQQVPASAAGSGDSNDSKKSKAKEEENKDEDKYEPKATEYFSRKIKKEKKDKAASTEASKPKSEIEGTFEKSTIQSASISIKESELTEKINKFFADKDYKKSFVCTLTINSDDKVESIVYQNPDIFHKGEQKEILAFFKKQKCFKNHEFSVYSTYTVNYKAQ